MLRVDNVGDAKSYQFLKFQGEGRDSFDFEGTMKKFVNHLDAANPVVQRVVKTNGVLEEEDKWQLEQGAGIKPTIILRRVNESLLESK